MVDPRNCWLQRAGGRASKGTQLATLLDSVDVLSQVLTCLPTKSEQQSDPNMHGLAKTSYLFAAVAAGNWVGSKMVGGEVVPVVAAAVVVSSVAVEFVVAASAFVAKEPSASHHLLPLHLG